MGVAKPAKDQACRVCTRLAPHQLAWADAKILEGRSARYIAQKVGAVTRKDVAGHALRCPNSKKDKENEENGKEQGTDA